MAPQDFRFKGLGLTLENFQLEKVKRFGIYLG